MADARNAGAAHRLYHPYWRHAANFLGVAFVLVFGAITTWLMGWDERLTMALFAVAATPALVSLLIAIMSFVTDRRLRRLVREDAVLSWRRRRMGRLPGQEQARLALGGSDCNWGHDVHRCCFRLHCPPRRRTVLRFIYGHLAGAHRYRGVCGRRSLGTYPLEPKRHKARNAAGGRAFSPGPIGLFT